MEEAGINLNKRPNHLLYIIKRQTGVYQLILVDLLLNNLTEKHFRLFNFMYSTGTDSSLTGVPYTRNSLLPAPEVLSPVPLSLL